MPDVRGPLDPWHEESYLIGWLVKLHGWYVLEPGVLRRRWRPRPVPAALVPDKGRGLTDGSTAEAGRAA